MNLKNKRILLTGGAGFLGQAVQKKLCEQGVMDKNIYIPRHKDLDLRIWENCLQAVNHEDIVIHIAANCGGIQYNIQNPGKLYFDNVMMNTQIMEAARIADVEKFVNIGCICAYPKDIPLPFKEEDFFNGEIESTNAPYGYVKRAALVQTQAYRQEYGMDAIYLLPVNLYGPNDNFHPEYSHVIPGLIRKFIEAKENGGRDVIVWGTGKASREFLYVEDCAEAILLATEKYSKPDPVNLGSGQEIKIKDLVNLIAELTDFNGKIFWDKSKPDGQPRRKLDVSKAKEEFGFKAETDFREGLKKTIEWWKENRK